MPAASDARISGWNTAGPLDQPCEDAVHNYFDALGPGSYTSVPFDPGYQAAFGATIRKTTGVRVERWPDEGRRWPGGLRKSELQSRLLAIQGVKSATISNVGGSSLIDIDPTPLQTLAPSGVYLVVT